MNFKINNDKFLIKNTTKEQRQQFVNDALALSILDAPEPTEDIKALTQKYIDGEMEIEEIEQIVLKKYMSK